MTVWRWTCGACGQSHTSDRAPLPIVCRCGVVDATGAGLVPLESDPTAPPPPPPVAARARHVSAAAAKWLAAGCPTRPDDQASAIYREHCAGESRGQPCAWLVAGFCRHPTCGCRVVDPAAVSGDTWFPLETITGGLWNKLKWATEVCPAGYWS